MEKNGISESGISAAVCRQPGQQSLPVSIAWERGKIR
jgi:hypothetical protein